MGEKSNTEFPFKPLGAWIRRMREKSQKSLAEVSGAVEIDSDLLKAMEQGVQRPSEDILMLLISYFAIKEEDAVEVWELAGYTKSDANEPTTGEADQVQPVIVMPMDARIVYTDMVNIKQNKYGLTINFLQSDGIGGKPLAVSRVGMSRDHAEKLLVALAEAFKKEQKLLPPPKDTGKDKR
jgi:transcriptional regulator with XRE-family HTH domain